MTDLQANAIPLVRLQKYLSGAGICSRRKAEQFIREGKIKINGKTVTQLGTKIDPETDRVEVNGNEVKKRSESIYIALNKPKGYVSSCKHPGQKIILDLIDIKERVYPIGRLDRDSHGLLLLTNDGRLHQRLTHPSFNHEKEYDVIVEKNLSERDLKLLAEGIVLERKVTRPAVVKRLGSKRFRIILLEGRKRQIRRMVKSLENRVVELKRIRVANIRLGRLPLGKWRRLSEKEIKTLTKHL